jgi:hypothetical protein
VKDRCVPVLNPFLRSVVLYSHITDDPQLGESAQRLGLYVAEESTHSNIGFGIRRRYA